LSENTFVLSTTESPLNASLSTWVGGHWSELSGEIGGHHKPLLTQGRIIQNRYPQLKPCVRLRALCVCVCTCVHVVWACVHAKDKQQSSKHDHSTEVVGCELMCTNWYCSLKCNCLRSVYMDLKRPPLSYLLCLVCLWTWPLVGGKLSDVCS